MSGVLFPLPSDSVATTSDDCYTPRWVFDAMGLKFDLDVAAPPGGPWHVPARHWFTAEDDGLAQPWDGLVWCNPPYSNFWPWAQRWAEHDRGVLMGSWPWAQRWAEHDRGVLMGSWLKARWNRTVTDNADVVAFLGAVKFDRPGFDPIELRQHVFVAFRGVDVAVAEDLASGDPRASVLYGRSAA